MAVDSGPLIGIEKRKVRAGHWRVEGFDVIRQQGNRWHIYLGGQLTHGGKRTLAAAIEWIVDDGRRWKI